MKHTPGPWTLHDTHDGGLALVEAECLRITVDHREDFGRAKPDATLIAAAPELLAALKLCLPLLIKFLDVGDLRLEMVRAAIAKAEGRDADT